MKWNVSPNRNCCCCAAEKLCLCSSIRIHQRKSCVVSIDTKNDTLQMTAVIKAYESALAEAIVRFSSFFHIKIACYIFGIFLFEYFTQTIYHIWNWAKICFGSANRKKFNSKINLNNSMNEKRNTHKQT